MADDEFNFDDDTGASKGGGGGDVSLDDFFEPAGGDKPKTKDSGPSIDDFFSPPADEESSFGEDLPLDPKQQEVAPEKSAKPAKKAPPKPAPEPEPTPLSEAEPAQENAPPEGGKGFLAANWLWLVVGALAIAVIGAGGFLGYTFFLKKPDANQTVAVKPAVPPIPIPPKPKRPMDDDDARPTETKPAKPAGAAAAKPTETKPAKPAGAAAAKPTETKPAKPAGAAADKPTETKPAKPAGAAADKPTETKPAKPADALADKPTGTKPAKPADALADKPTGTKPAKPTAITMKEPPKTPAKEPAQKPAARQPAVAASGGPFYVQVGSYMMEASRSEVEEKLRDLGYGNIQLVPESRRLRIHHVFVGGNLSRAEAADIMAKLEGWGYAPQYSAENGGSVLVYSYGNLKTARSVQAKLKKKNIGAVRISSETTTVDLQQVRVGGYPSRSEADKVAGDLKRNGFRDSVVVVE